MQQRRRHQKSGETRARTQRAQNRTEHVSLAARWLLPQNTERKLEQRKQEKRHIPTSK
jgi:hypothetical protein